MEVVDHQPDFAHVLKLPRGIPVPANDGDLKTISRKRRRRRRGGGGGGGGGIEEVKGWERRAN